MTDPYNLHRFIEAQAQIFDTALAELSEGRKQSHWMWFIFPQLAGLGRGPTAQYYGISSLDEARAYLEHRPLGPRLRQCTETIIPWAGRRTAEQVLGPIDAMKLRSCFTLFDRVEQRTIFADGLQVYFNGEPDERTLALLDGQS